MIKKRYQGTESQLFVLRFLMYMWSSFQIMVAFFTFFKIDAFCEEFRNLLFEWLDFESLLRISILGFRIFSKNSFFKVSKAPKKVTNLMVNWSICINWLGIRSFCITWPWIRVTLTWLVNHHNYNQLWNRLNVHIIKKPFPNIKYKSVVPTKTRSWTPVGYRSGPVYQSGYVRDWFSE